MASSSGTQNVQPTIAFSSVGVAEVAKNGRGMKTDPTWEHGVMIDEATRRVRYNYSSQEFTGGTYRFKHHLAGTSKDVKSCKLVPDDVKKTVEDIVYDLQKKLLKKIVLTSKVMLLKLRLVLIQMERGKVYGR
ncbi:hypothetical protein TSUD_417630 [Trifolium subterraneum]|uniref:BED-type domain-containing protein n=1 Tax=Trifolium subterraneum TaxID=3900 RepID=A0A2Z6PJV7_TRISU|nr:hypothetical protein TSUD_417630 [Trifolium subterraneum]